MTVEGAGSDALLLAHLQRAREHVLATVTGVADADLTRAVAPSGWSIVSLLTHLTYDDEIFWIQAILGGDPDAIDRIQDGWRASVIDPQEAILGYRLATQASTRVLADADLDSPPAWWPPTEVFPFPAFGTGRECVFRVLAETQTHAGHLDIVRELIDGHQHLVLG